VREKRKRKSKPATIVDRGPVVKAAYNSSTAIPYCFVAIWEKIKIK